MKITFACFSALLVLVLSGCAGAPTRGGSSSQALGGQVMGQGHAIGSSDIVDYRQVLSDPGPF